MNSIKLALLVVSLGVSIGKAAAQSGEPWRTRISRVVRDTVLANGLTVIIAENHAVPLVTVQVSFRGGAAMQGPGEEGLAHLAEHYLFRAYGDENAFAGDVAAFNGTYNGTTSEEEVNYYITLPSKDMASGIRVISKLVREPKLNDGALDAEKKIVADELARDRSVGASALRVEMGAQLWDSDWFRKNVAGTERSVNAIRLDRIKLMLATQYVPANAAVIVSGDIDTGSALSEVIKRFGDWAVPAVPVSSAGPVSSLGNSKTFATTAPDVHLVTVSVQWPGPSAQAAATDAISAEVFAEMVGSAISPAVRRMMTDGPFHSMGASFDVLSNRGAFTISGVLSPAGADRGLAIMKAEIDRIGGAEYLNDTLLTAAKRRLRVRAEYTLESGVVLASALGRTWSAAGLDYFRNYGDAIDGVTLEAVESFVKKYLVSRPYVAGVLAPPAERDRMRLAVGTTLGRKTP